MNRTSCLLIPFIWMVAIALRVSAESVPVTYGALTASSTAQAIPFGAPRIVVNEKVPLGYTRAGDRADVTITTGFQGGQIFYTLDGSVPGVNSIAYTGPFSVTNSVAIRALAFSDDFRQQAISDLITIQVVSTFELRTIVTVGDEDLRVAEEFATSSATTALGPTVPGQQVGHLLTVGNTPIVVTHLGGYDVQAIGGDGMADVIIWNSSGVIVASNRVSYLGSNRYSFVELKSPVTLAARERYFVGVSGSNGVFAGAEGAVFKNVPERYTVDGDVVYPNGQVPFVGLGASMPAGFYASANFLFTDVLVGRHPSMDRYLQDDIVALEPVASGGLRFVRWEGDLTGSFPERNVVMDRDKTVRAVFEAIPRYSLSTVALGGTATGGGTYYEGTEVAINAAPATGWTFLDWSGDYIGTETNFTWRVDGPATFEARFGTTVATLATGPGRVVLEPELEVYPYGSQVKVIPVPDSGNYLALWGDAGTGQPKTSWALTVTNGTPRVTALFLPVASDKAVLTVQSTLGGTVQQPNADGIYPLGTVVALTAAPEPGYDFTGWSGDASGTDLSISVTVDTSKTVRAEFVRSGVASHPLSVTVTGPGTVRRVPDQGAYEEGSEVELVAEPTGTAVFAGWSGDANGTQRRIRVTINGPTEVGASFLEVHPVATEVRGEGQILLSPPDGSYAEGTAVAATAKPAEGWGFVRWSGDLATTSQEAAFTVDAPKQLIAEFARLGTLTTEVEGQGSVARSPEAESYLPGTVVNLTATAAEGWRFVRWSGGASGEEPTLILTVGRTEAIVAEFADAALPEVTLTSPQAGTEQDERFRLEGTVIDNVGVTEAGWIWNGVDQGALTLNNGSFLVEGLNLIPGVNTLMVHATDRAGNRGEVTREVTWEPVRTLRVSNAAEVQEGRQVTYRVDQEAPGDVSGLTFRLDYDPQFLVEPEMEWGGLVGQSVNSLNTSTNGQIWAAFALAGTTLPEGTNRVGSVRFRARSVPEITEVALVPKVQSMSGGDGAVLFPGNAAVAGTARITPRRITGDNNANQRLDIGDAVVIARLQVGLEEVRPWDVPLNDLNGSQAIDNGDVVRVLRVVVGLDPAPSPARVVALAGGPIGNTNDVVVLELPDGDQAMVGQPWRMVVRLDKTAGPISGLSFTVNHPESLGLTDRVTGALIPGDALPLWNTGAGTVSLAAVRASEWPTSTGTAAVLTFTPAAGFETQAEWELTVSPVEVTGSGFDIRPLDPVTVVVRSARVPIEPPVIAPPALGGDGTLSLEIYAGAGEELVLETATDLSDWIEDRVLTGQGRNTPVRVNLTPDTTTTARFWRVVRR